MDTPAQLLAFYFPLGVIGAWRWGSWLLRKGISLLYRPAAQAYDATVSIVVPVYNEDPETFLRAVESWRANGPKEIIAVIDHTDADCIREFSEFAGGFDGAKLVITEEPGKRPALARGIGVSSGEIIALVDSDTVWDDSVLEKALRPFADPKVGGATTRQNVLDPKALSQSVFDIQLDVRFYDEMLPVAAAGNVLSCLSGRTAFYRREALLPAVPDMVHETFWGRQCIGGEDKALTYLIQAAGWATRYQHNAQVFTPGARDLSTLIKQRIRWSRNSWRADLRAFRNGWVWRHPFLAFALIDRFLSPFTLTIGLIYFVTSLMFQMWIPAAVLFAWWLFSRSMKILPHLLRRPDHVRLVPAYLLANFATSIIRIYSLLTLNRQDWMTRRGAERAPVPPTMQLGLAKDATFAILAGIAVAISYFGGHAFTETAPQQLSAGFLMALAALITWVAVVTSLTIEAWTRR